MGQDGGSEDQRWCRQADHCPDRDVSYRHCRQELNFFLLLKQELYFTSSARNIFMHCSPRLLRFTTVEAKFQSLEMDTGLVLVTNKLQMQLLCRAYYEARNDRKRVVLVCGVVFQPKIGSKAFPFDVKGILEGSIRVIQLSTH